MKLPDHLFVSECEGHLYDTRIARWSELPPLRRNYRRSHRDIKTVSDLKATLRYGDTAWPGGYPIYFITNDGAAMSFKTVRKQFRSVADSIRNKLTDGWRVCATDINYDDPELYDDHTSERIPSAYAEDEAERAEAQKE